VGFYYSPVVETMWVLIVFYKVVPTIRIPLTIPRIVISMWSGPTLVG